jgi:glutathione synthase/RimK-type ligase-like ATP-grasp enzyme
MDKLLIITGKDDVHADHIISKLLDEGKGDAIVRLHHDDALSNLVCTYHLGELEVYIKDSGRHFKTSEVKCVWYRKPNDLIIPESIAPDAREFAQGQISSLLQGLHYLTADHAYWINPRRTAYIARNKVKQLQVATQLGFDVPDTIITNSPDRAIAFGNRHQLLCAKDIDTTTRSLYNERYPFYTLKMTPDEVRELSASIALVPTLLQQFIEKAFDLRVIAVRDQLFAVAIHSQELEAARDDFRVVAPTLLKHTPHDLPTDLADKIKTFMSYYGLVFSAFDFAVTQDGRYYFLENNPNGQWLWLEDQAGVAISQAFLDTFAAVLGWKM